MVTTVILTSLETIFVSILIIGVKYPVIFGKEDWLLKDKIKIVFERTPSHIESNDYSSGISFTGQRFLGEISLTYQFTAEVSVFQVLKWKSNSFISDDLIITEWKIRGGVNELFKRDILAKILSEDLSNLLGQKVQSDAVIVDLQYREFETKIDEHYRKMYGDA